MKLKLDKQQETELRLALRNKDYATYHRRIQSILFRHEGMTLMAISQLVGYSHQTIANQVKVLFKIVVVVVNAFTSLLKKKKNF